VWVLPPGLQQMSRLVLDDDDDDDDDDNDDDEKKKKQQQQNTRLSENTRVFIAQNAQMSNLAVKTHTTQTD
jgi:hypothetical protein